MKWLLFVSTFCFANICAVNATETDVEAAEEQTLFSPTFFEELSAASQTTDPIGELEKLHSKVKRSSELAEVELTIARFYCQRTGFVEPTKAVKWYDKALVRGLPVTALVRQYILRWNMHERLGHRDESLMDYIRGWLICAQYNLPSKWPSGESSGHVRLPPMNSGIGYNEKPTDAEKFLTKQQYQDYRRDHDATKRDQGMLCYRYYYVDAIKRVMKEGKMSETDLRSISEGLTNRPDRTNELLRQNRGPNAQPWP